MPPKSVEEIITDIIKREGEKTDDPADRGGRTEFGISEAANPEAWADNKVTEAEARAIYEAKYVLGPKFDKILDPGLRAQLVDYGVNSGPMIAIMKLQEIVHEVVDGVLGPDTLHALSNYPPEYVNNRLVIARVKMIGRIISKNPTQVKYINGWLDRATQFLV